MERKQRDAAMLSRAGAVGTRQLQQEEGRLTAAVKCMKRRVSIRHAFTPKSICWRFARCCFTFYIKTHASAPMFYAAFMSPRHVVGVTSRATREHASAAKGREKRDGGVVAVVVVAMPNRDIEG